MIDLIDTSRKIIKKEDGRQNARTYRHQDHRRARYLHEMEGYSLPRISEETNIPVRTLASWKEKEVWKKKGADVEKVNMWTRERFLELSAANGMPKQKAVALMVQGMTEPSIETAPAIVDEEGTEVVKAKNTPDFNTRNRYQKDYWNLTGMMGGGGKGMDIHPEAGGTVNIQVNIPDKDAVVSQGDS